MTLKDIIENAIKTVVFFGKKRKVVVCPSCGKHNPDDDKPKSEKEEISFFGTGLILTLDGIHHIATAKHVVYDSNTLKDDEICIFMNNKNDGGAFIDMKKFIENNKVKWITHKNPDMDIALIPITLKKELVNVLAITENIFITTNEIKILDYVFFIAYQPGIEDYHQISPIYRKGSVSRIKNGNQFIIDANAFPGNSGSPVFIISEMKVRFAGIIGAYFSYEEAAFSVQTQKQRVIFEENTGLSLVASTDAINEIKQQEDFKNQIKYIKEELMPVA